MNLNWRFVSFPCEDTRFKRIFTDDRRDGMSSESKRSIHWCRTIQSSYDFTDTQKTRSGHEGLDESHGKNHSTAFYRFPSRRVVFHDKRIQVLQEPRRNTLCGRGLVLVGGATHVGGVYGGGAVLPLWKDSLIHRNKHWQPRVSQTAHDCSDLRESSWSLKIQQKILCFSPFC